MKINAFKIINFRSIVDSGWVPLSPDGITVLVGQNESGKSSVLDAINCVLTDTNPTTDDFRIGTDLPIISLRLDLMESDVDLYLKDIHHYQKSDFKKYLNISKNRVIINCRWFYELQDNKRKIERSISFEDDKLNELIYQSTDSDTSKSNDEIDKKSQNKDSSDEFIYLNDLDNDESSLDIAYELWAALPLAVLFSEDSGKLPSQVDIDENGQPTGPGAQAALNFLKIAEIDLPILLRGDRRSRENTLNKANSRVSDDFNSFWSQTIGKSGRLTLKCDIDNYEASKIDKAGKPHLVFWICDGTTQLYPKQRSQGVRWFISFYLQLKASEKTKNKRVFLLDEPGANLHSKAQADVLKLINQLGKDNSSVIYSTHSPQMLEYPKLFRVHAVQRDGELDDSPTKIIDAHRLGTASSDTLSPLLTAMGADLSQHQVVRKENNVLLEEMSGYYYLSSFWKLCKSKKEVHFIAATGVNKIEALANMFRGWGLGFSIAIDDDSQGRSAYNSMKRELFGDDDKLAAKRMLKFPGCTSIEDVLCKQDFKKYVLKDESIVIAGKNSEYIKSASRSKPVLAFGFSLAVENGDVTIEELSSDSQVKIKEIVAAIEDRLTNQN